MVRKDESGRIKKRNKQAAETSHLAPNDFSRESIVEIERNFIEKYALASKHWIMNNIETTRKIAWSFLTFIALIFVLLFINSQIKAKHNKRFYYLLETYNVVKLAPPGEEREKNLDTLITDTKKFCQTFWSSRYSKNGCLLLALSYQAKGNTKKFAETLKDFGDSISSNAFASYFLFYAAYSFEASFQLDKAYEIYHALEDSYKAIKREDISLFHKARILYLQKKNELSKSMFEKLISDFPTSQYQAEAKKYLLMLQVPHQ